MNQTYTPKFQEEYSAKIPALTLLTSLGWTFLSPKQIMDYRGYKQDEGKRAARTVLTGMCYSVGSATRQGSSSLTRFIGQSAMTSRT